MEGQPYPYYILCKGNHLRIALMVPPEVIKKKSLDTIKKECLRQVSDRGKQFGRIVKVEDF